MSQQKKTTFFVGLTGYIGSGKSSVRMLMEAASIPALDADEATRHVLEHSGDIIKPLLDRFGSQVIRDGGIYRPFLSSIVFSDPQARKDLEAIVRPQILQLIQRWMRRVEGSGAPVAVIEAIDFSDAELSSQLDELWVVTCPREVRFHRLEGPGMNRQEAERRLSSQRELVLPRHCPHVEISNAGSVEDLQQVVTEAIQQLRTRIAAREV